MEYETQNLAKAQLKQLATESTITEQNETRNELRILRLKTRTVNKQPKS